jgi:hypothetical protein
MGQLMRGHMNIVAQLVPDAAMRSQADPANRIIEDILMRGYNSVETKSIINTTDEIDELVRRTVSALGDDPEARAICIIPVGMRAAFTEAAKSAGLWDDARAQKKFFDYGSPDAQPDPVTQFAFGLEFLEYCRTSPDASASASPKLLDLIVALTGCSDPQDALRKLFAGDVFVIRAVNWRNLDDRRRAWRLVETAL